MGVHWVHHASLAIWFTYVRELAYPGGTPKWAAVNSLLRGLGLLRGRKPEQHMDDSGGVCADYTYKAISWKEACKKNMAAPDDAEYSV